MLGREGGRILDLDPVSARPKWNTENERRSRPGQKHHGQLTDPCLTSVFWHDLCPMLNGNGSNKISTKGKLNYSNKYSEIKLIICTLCGVCQSEVKSYYLCRR